MSIPRALSRCHCLVSLALLSPTLALAAGPSGPTLDIRYRYEQVDDDAFVRDADASTLRARVGYRWAISSQWTAFAEGEYVTHLFGDDFNSTTNGRSTLPTVADPDETELNQAYLNYADGDFKATAGRQRLIFDNQRFIGNVGWRQNEQTFDALDLSYRLAPNGPTLRYAYLERVHRVFGDHHPQGEWNLDTHALNLSQALPVGTLVAYAYLIDNQDVASGSSATYGLRWSASRALAPAITLGWTLEAARQNDYAGNPRNLSADYVFIEPTLALGEFNVRGGYERLDGNGVAAFQTPLATLHAFNGWADRFLTTPVNGLEDAYLGVGGKHGAWNWQALWHDFSAERGGAEYGTELDASLGYAVRSNLSVLIKFADYNSRGFSSDERKLWASVEYRY